MNRVLVGLTVLLLAGLSVGGCQSAAGSEMAEISAGIVNVNGDAIAVEEFLLSPTEVTVAEWEQFVEGTGLDFQWGGYPPATRSVAAVSPGDDYPIVLVSWIEAIQYCNWLSDVHGLDTVYEIEGDSVRWNRDADGYRLPAELEWQRAALATAEKAASVGWDAVAWYAGNSGETTHAVGSKQPDSFGVHDLSGNVSEWCWDFFSVRRATDLTGPAKPNLGNPLTAAMHPNPRVTRGASYASTESYQQIVEYRNYHQQDGRAETLGFRVARNK